MQTKPSAVRLALSCSDESSVSDRLTVLLYVFPPGLAPVLCKLARWVYNLSWTFLAGLTWLLVDLYACLSDDIDPADEVVLKLGGDGQLHEQDVSLGDILRDLVRATFADLIASIQRLPAACLTRPDGLVHLA